jgi:hypothetical protein
MCIYMWTNTWLHIITCVYVYMYIHIDIYFSYVYLFSYIHICIYINKDVYVNDMIYIFVQINTYYIHNMEMRSGNQSWSIYVLVYEIFPSGLFMTKKNHYICIFSIWSVVHTARTLYKRNRLVRTNMYVQSFLTHCLTTIILISLQHHRIIASTGVLDYVLY